MTTMRRTPFRAVLEEVLAGVGLSYDAANQTQLDAAANFINRRIAEAWDWAAWQETLRCELRGFADPWNDALPYASGDVVWYETGLTYYEAQTTVPAGTVLSNATYWAECDRPTQSLIEWDQYNTNEIGRVWRITRYDYFSDTANTSYSWAESNEGVVVRDCTLDAVYLLFNLRPPLFSGKAHSGAGAYSVGDIVYSPAAETAGIFPQDGECYKAAKDTEGNEVWQLVEFPARFALYVGAAASADMMRLYGQKEAAQERLAEARQYLQEEALKAGSGAEIDIELGL